MNVNDDSGDVLDHLEWVKSPSLSHWNNHRLLEARQLIYETTGELYDTKRLQMLPLDERFGMWVLSDGRKDYGIFLAMKLNKQTARVLAFSISTDLQGKRIRCTRLVDVCSGSQNLGIKQVQLEVRQDNTPAIRLYQRRGLRPRGYITGFYRGHDGWLMMGPCGFKHRHNDAAFG